MPAPSHTPAHYSPRAEAIFRKFAKPQGMSLEELICHKINEEGCTIRDLAAEWGCSVSLVSQIVAQLGLWISRHSKATQHPRGGKAVR